MPLYRSGCTPARYGMFDANREKVILNRVVLTELQNTINLMQGNRFFLSISLQSEFRWQWKVKLGMYKNTEQTLQIRKPQLTNAPRQYEF